MRRRLAFTLCEGLAGGAILLTLVLLNPTGWVGFAGGAVGGVLVGDAIGRTINGFIKRGRR